VRRRGARALPRLASVAPLVTPLVSPNTLFATAALFATSALVAAAAALVSSATHPPRNRGRFGDESNL